MVDSSDNIKPSFYYTETENEREKIHIPTKSKCWNCFGKKNSTTYFRTARQK